MMRLEGVGKKLFWSQQGSRKVGQTNTPYSKTGFT